MDIKIVNNAPSLSLDKIMKLVSKISKKHQFKGVEYGWLNIPFTKWKFEKRKDKHPDVITHKDIAGEFFYNYHITKTLIVIKIWVK